MYRFEELDVWKSSASLSAEIYKSFNELKDFGFRDQITKSSLSVPSNIAEGMERISAKEKIRFLDISKGSAAELRTQTYIGAKIGYISPEIGNEWIEETREISSMLVGLMKSLREEQ